ncbi:MBOAT family protein [Laspinema sp. D1]|uniref:MBOAT family protein n=1 Tax=Laspinema palackyanum D2a TaxID=2953684 RepID=A0ABT2MMR4_9CYAN|nr:MBOAT family protein [Laspinema sp. D2a]
MLFNSYEFIFIFLPLALIVFFGLSAYRQVKAATLWLLLASLVFYGYWRISYIPLLLISILGNYYFGRWIDGVQPGTKKAKTLLWAGVLFNLGILGYYKYAGFLIASINGLFQTQFPVPAIELPLGISFYSFTQIAYLVDAYRGQTKDYQYDLVSYSLFVTFFPQLIAGPILRHDELIPQFTQLRKFVFSHKNVAIGLSFFILGLGKKVLIADTVSPWVGAVFEQADSITFIEAWVGAIAYTLQLYFDFSGYSDMAIGLGWMFNFRLPINFDSPYKSTSIVDFWRRWHITLSFFLRDYLYIALGGSRRGQVRRYFNLLLTMLLGGLWHGAGWTYILWGWLHGTFLVINHGWRRLGLKMPVAIAWVITFLAVVLSWVVFRAENITQAGQIIQAAVGLKGIILTPDFQPLLGWLPQSVVQFREVAQLPALPPNYRQSFVILAVVLMGAVLLPNTQQMVERFKPTTAWAVGLSAVAIACLLSLNRISEFLYFQF